jgi:hypothetical protein
MLNLILPTVPRFCPKKGNRRRESSLQGKGLWNFVP